MNRIMLARAASFLYLMLLGFPHNAHALLIETTYTDLNSKIIGGVSNLPVIGNTPLDFILNNQTGETWTDFHVQSTIVGGFNVDTYQGPGSAVFSDVRELLGTTFAFNLDIFNISVANGGSLNFSADLFCAGEVCSLGTFLSGYPTTVPETTVPEPASISVLIISLAGIGFWASRRPKSA